MDEHLIFFIDIVGFAGAVRSWGNEKIETLTALLSDFAALRSESEYTVIQAHNTLSYARLSPAITTFSDHIVMSYPIELLQRLNPDQGLLLGLQEAQSRVGELTAATARLGLLIRGGLTVGPLYHANGVVLGKAMNEAYELESRVAVYPRIAVSRKVYSQTNSPALQKDSDGITHFDYFPHMIVKGGGPSGPQYASRLREWFSEVQRVAAENMTRFEEEENWNYLAKWVWFKNRLEQTRANLPDGLFETATAGPSRTDE